MNDLCGNENVFSLKEHCVKERKKLHVEIHVHIYDLDMLHVDVHVHACSFYAPWAMTSLLIILLTVTAEE